MIWAALAVLVVVLAVGGLALTISSKRSYDASNLLIPGTPTRAPAEWAGAHTPEARLHRRLRDTLAALHRQIPMDQVGLRGLRTSLEAEAVAIDEKLIATAALPARVRQEPLERVTHAVETFEEAVAGIIANSHTGVESGSIEDTAEQISIGLDAIGAARQELDRLYPDTPEVDAAHQVLRDAALGADTTTERGAGNPTPPARSAPAAEEESDGGRAAPSP